MESRHRYSVALCLSLGPLCGLFWSKGAALPSLMVGSFSLSLVGVALAGVMAQSFADRIGARSANETRRVQPGIFQLLWLGQLALFALALVVTPPAAVLADLTGFRVSLRVSLPFMLVSLAYLTQRKRKIDLTLVTGLPGASVVIAALVGIALYRGLALHSFHAGALGHDTQQHIYWTEHIFDYGYLPLTSRGSDRIEEYPRFFHLLAACWSALGYAPTTGPFVKVMPLLQLSLTAGFAAELVLTSQSKSKRMTLASLCVGGFLAWHLTRGSARGIMPVPNLSGTPRFSAGWVLFGLPLLVLAYRVGSLPTGRTWLITLAPVYAAIAAGINPVLGVLYMAFTLPFSAMLYVFSGMGIPAQRIQWRKPLLAGCAMAGLLLLANPFVVSALSRASPVKNLLGWAGARTSSAGLDRSHWIAEPEHVAWCDQELLPCAVDHLRAAVQTAVAEQLEALALGTLPIMPGHKHYLWYWLVFAIPWIALSYAACRRFSPRSFDPFSARLFVGICAAAVLSCLPVLVIGALLWSSASLGASWVLLASYFGTYPLLLGSSMQALLTLSAWAFTPAVTLRSRVGASLVVIAALILSGTLTSFVPRALAKNIFTKTGARIDWRELHAISALNRFVPDHETVLIPARYHALGASEHILTANTPLGLIASHLDTGLLFAFSLGTGVDYGWADLSETFCGPSAESRSALLRQARVHWVLLRGKRAKSREHFEDFHWDCGVRLSDLRAEFPAAWHRRDLALYRIDP